MFKIAILSGILLAIIVTIFEQRKYNKLKNRLNESLSRLEKIEITSLENHLTIKLEE